MHYGNARSSLRGAKGGPHMRGFLETLVIGATFRGLGPALAVTLMAAPLRKTTRAQLKKIYVLDAEGDMAGEYVLDPDCPIDYNDFLKVLPDDGIGDREALFVGEYVFTAFQSDKFVFVLLSRGHLAPEDVEWTATLLTAADAHLAAGAKGAAQGRAPESPKPGADLDRGGADRESRIEGREKELAKLEAQVKADEANLKGRSEEMARQKEHLTALADYVSQIQQSVTVGVSRALKTLEVAEQLSASSSEDRALTDSRSLAEARQKFEDERKALLQAKDDLEGKYREATERAKQLEQQVREGQEAFDRERKETAAREAEAERMRGAIETRVQELSARFAQMAKERLMNSHKETPAPAAPTGALKEMETQKAELAKERKFLQRRAIEMLDREEKLRGREVNLDEREALLAKREQDLAARETAVSRLKPAMQPAAVMVDADEARKDIERRVKIIQQKALELLDREEKLRKRAADLEALEARLSGRIPAR